MSDRLAARLAELRAQLRGVAAELDAMPRHLAGTEWHLDRADEARFLARTIARFESETAAGA